MKNIILSLILFTNLHGGKIFVNTNNISSVEVSGWLSDCQGKVSITFINTTVICVSESLEQVMEKLK